MLTFEGFLEARSFPRYLLQVRLLLRKEPISESRSSPRSGSQITSLRSAFDQRALPVLRHSLGDRISASSRSVLFFVLIRLLGERRTPDVLSRLQALSPDLFLRGALASSDPSDSELGVRLVVLNHDLVADLYLASATTQLHAMVADIESMREMDIFTPGDPDSYWHDRFGSRRVPLAYTKSRHVPRSLRVP